MAHPITSPNLENAESRGPVLERHFSVEELAGIWSLSADTVRRLFEREPGVQPRVERLYEAEVALSQQSEKKAWTFTGATPVDELETPKLRSRVGRYCPLTPIRQVKLRPAEKIRGYTLIEDASHIREASELNQIIGQRRISAIEARSGRGHERCCDRNPQLLVVLLSQCRVQGHRPGINCPSSKIPTSRDQIAGGTRVDFLIFGGAPGDIHVFQPDPVDALKEAAMRVIHEQIVYRHGKPVVAQRVHYSVISLPQVRSDVHSSGLEYPRVTGEHREMLY